MSILNRAARLRTQSVVASFVITACLLPGGSYFAAFAQKADEHNLSRPRRIDPASPSAEDGPVVRVALVTDASSVTLGSSSGFAALRYDQNKSEVEKMVAHPVRVELRQQLVRVQPNAPARDLGNNDLRVEVGSVSDSLEARKVIDDLKKRFDEPTSNVYDKESATFRILIGRFSTRSEAMAMIEQLRHAGYQAAHIATDGRASDQATDKNSKPAQKIARNAKSSKKTSAKVSKRVASKVKSSKAARSRAAKSERASSAPQYQQVTQVVALAGNRVIALTEDKLVVRAALSAGEDETPKRRDVEAQSSRYSEARKRDEEKLWGNAGQTGRDDSRSQAGSPAEPSGSRAASSSFIRVDDKYYRGEIRVTLNARGRLNVINAVPLEEYLRGVVPMELSPGPYPAIEALKAQAVAARTYALAHMKNSRDADFDLRDDTRSQVYGGISAEHEMTNRAIEQTRGIVALYTAEDGTDAPIEALYTANCGGQTENNEVIFGGKAMPYLRSVACAPDRLSIADRDIISNAAADSLVESDGRSILREIALLQVMGFQLPRRATNSYLRGTPDQDELQRWIDRASELSQKDKLRVARGDSTRLPGFALLVASAIYGEGRTGLLLTPADVDYILAGLEGKDAPQDVRASIAALLKDGILRLPASVAAPGSATPSSAASGNAASNGAFDNRAQITRAFALETLARAISFKSKLAQADSQKTQMARLRLDTARPSDSGRLVIASSTAKPQPQEVASAKTKAANFQEMKSKEVIARAKAVKESAPEKIPALESKPDGFEIDSSAWLFRNFGAQSYPVGRLTLIGGERIIFHLNAAGRVDFLEAAAADHSASSDRYSSVAAWQERVTAEEVVRRLARAHVNVGQIESITPVSFSESNRVIEIEITGYAGSARLRGPQIRSAFGLKENLFVVDRETDATGRITAFVFTGRGWGHGVGMCQTGAYGLAKEGFSYIAILQKYYTGVRVRKVY